MMIALTELANAHGTDKGTLVGNRHGYTFVYEKLFAGFRNEPISLVEVGLSIGGPEHGLSPSRRVVRVPSVSMWLDYFPQAMVTGIDISDCSAFETERFKFLQADCSDRISVRAAAEDLEADVIIDDGSHASFHQQVTMLELFPRLSSKGYYIIEDLDWQPDVYERELPSSPKTAALFSWLAARPRSFWSTMIGYHDWAPVLDQVESISLYTTAQLDDMAGISRNNRPWRLRLRSNNRIAVDPIKLAIIKKR